MLNATLIRDLRKNLNEAQDYGQEALVWWKRWNKIGDPEMASQVEQNARIAWNRAANFVEFADQVGCHISEQR